MRLLDLYCGAGGCSVGFNQAGFEVVGVDIERQPHYPFEFVQEDAMDVLDDLAAGRFVGYGTFDAFHASPPCQGYSSLTRLGKSAGVGAPLLIGEVRERLAHLGAPYVIENVEAARSYMRRPYRLCGSSFGLGVRRHRLFETNFPMMVPACGCHPSRKSVGVYGDHPQVSIGIEPGHTLQEAQAAMGIDWMPWQSLREAIPPAYTEHIGEQLLSQMRLAV